jgi:DNA-binding transcriptional ArsR family regulator
MDIFHALSDPTRRAILELLASSGQLPASSISERFAMSAPAISQHLKVLRESTLVNMRKSAQQRLYSVNPDGMLQMELWIAEMQRFTNQKLDDLEISLLVESQAPTKEGTGDDDSESMFY